MKLGMKRAIAGASAFAIVGATAAALAGSASASVPSPWEPDANSKGSVVFYDATGHVLTGGNSLSHLADYYAVTSAGTAGATKATLYFAAPDHTQADPSGWTQVSRSASTTFPQATNPAPIQGPGFTFPVVKAGATDGNLATFLPGVTLDSTANYANIIQVRVYDSIDSSLYWETNISYNLGAGTWSVNDPTVTATTTTLTATPPSPQTAPASAVTLNAVVAPAKAGTVAFFEGATQLGATQTVTNVSGAASVNIGAPSTADHTYTAVFTPAGGTLVSGSTSSPLLYHVGAPLIGTTTVLSINTGTGIAAGVNPVVFTANVTATPATTGTVTIKEGLTTIGTSPVGPTSGPLVFSTTALTAGPHLNVTATFNPADPAYSGSTSAPGQDITLTAPTCPVGTCDVQTITADIPAGTIVIATPYTAAAPLDVPLQLDPTATFYTGQAAFNGIHVTDTRAGNLPWDLKAKASNLVNGANQDNGQNVGLTALVIDSGTPSTVSTAAGNLTVTNQPAASPVVVNPLDGGSLGLGGIQHTLIHANQGIGTITYKGTLTINAPTNLPAGTYTGTITFTVG